MKKILSWIVKAWLALWAGLKKAAVALIDGVMALDAKAKTIKWCRTKAEVAGAVVLIVATVIVVNPVKHKQQPTATVKKVTVKKVVENPTPKQVKTADAVITEKTTVKVSGTAKIKPKATATPKESKYTIPLSGEATTTYIDTETGAAVGTGTHPVTGQADITVQDDIVTADVTINDTNSIAMVIKREPRKNEFGGYGGVAACSDPYFYAGAYYQRNLALYQGKKADMALFARASVERRWGADEDWEGRITAGVRVEW
jgi:hypothetical protein